MKLNNNAYIYKLNNGWMSQSSSILDILPNTLEVFLLFKEFLQGYIDASFVLGEGVEKLADCLRIYSGVYPKLLVGFAPGLNGVMKSAVGN